MMVENVVRAITGSLGAIGRCLGLQNISFLQKIYVAVMGLMLPNRDVVVPVDGQNMLVPNPRQSTLGRMIYLYGVWEPSVSQFLASKLRPGMLVLDVGAHVGYYTLLMAKQVQANGKVIAFEPNRVVRELLIKNIELNEFHQVMVEPFALFSGEGTTTLESLDSSNTRLSLHGEVGTREQVALRTFDSCKTELGIDTVDLVKMDVEGAELDVLQGMRELLHEHHPELLIEVHLEGLAQFGHTPAELQDYVKSLGYDIEPIWSQEGTDTIFCRRVLPQENV